MPKAVAELKAEDNGIPVCEAYLRKMVKQGVLPHHLIGNRIIVSIEDIKSLYDGKLCSAKTPIDSCNSDSDGCPVTSAASAARGGSHV